MSAVDIMRMIARRAFLFALVACGSKSGSGAMQPNSSQPHDPPADAGAAGAAGATDAAPADAMIAATVAPSADCAPQDAYFYDGSRLCTPEPRYLWQGGTCVVRDTCGVPCHGRDCGREYASAEQCMTAYAHCTDAKPCSSSGDCGDDEYCAFVPELSCGMTDVPGACVAVPSSCAADNLRVCGCNKVDYPNPCEAFRARQTIATFHMCPDTVSKD